MKILLTGKNRSGKTTLLEKLIRPIQPKRGLITLEVHNENDRIGFDMRAEEDRVASLARIDSPTPYAVGRYFVDISALEAFIKPLFTFKPNELLFIDEISQMQLYSDKFKLLAKTYLDSPNDFIGTISSIYEHPFIDEVRSRTDLLLCTITPENRQAIEVVLFEALVNRQLFNDMSSGQKTNRSKARSALSRGWTICPTQKVIP